MAFVAAAAWTQSLAVLPSGVGQVALCGLGGVAAIVLYQTKQRWGQHLAVLVFGSCIGMLNAVWQAQGRLAEGLATEHHNEVARLALRVDSLPDGDVQGWRFDAALEGAVLHGMPKRVRVTWNAAPGERTALPALVPGQVWRMAVVLRRPHALQNPGLPDAEARWFAQGVSAMATVRGQPRLLSERPWASSATVLARIRHHVREGMRRALGEHRYAPILIALAIGDQASIARDDWRIFNRSGITHLVSISGLHVSLVAGLAGLGVAACWRRTRWRGVGVAEYVPARIVGCAAAVLVALLYCLLAGWGIPARRAFFMLATVLGAMMLRLPLSAMRLLLLAATVVTALDPWAPLATGFWLSFGAVAILLHIAQEPPERDMNRWQKILWRFKQAGRVQGWITLGLVPLLAFWVGQISLASPLANAIAIPVLSLLVTPLALLCAIFSIGSLGQTLAVWVGLVGVTLLDWTMQPVTWIGNARWASFYVAAAPWPWLLLALAGMGWALQPRGGWVRYTGWLWMLPLLCWQPKRPAAGDWRLMAVDIGQGSAIVVETATQTLLFDTGPRHYGGTDMGERIVVPALRARGLDHIDELVLSHADIDHVGGVGAVLSALPVRRSHASFDLASFLRDEARRWADQPHRRPIWPAQQSRCLRGQHWEADGVQFTFLHPQQLSTSVIADRNAESCVLRIQGVHHSVLLTGDIGVAQERILATDLPPTDVVLAPHHGSASSSGPALVRAAQATHVIAQAGMLNRFNHPAAAVEQRWRQAGAQFWRSDAHGAVVVTSTGTGLDIWAQRVRGRRYWHGRYALE